jgi:peroxin-6
LPDPPAQTTELSIPSRWLKVYGHIFSQSNSLPVAVVAVQPVLLSEVVVTALSTDSYRAARSRGSLLERWLSNDSPILRQGAIHSFSADLLPTNGHNPTWKQFHYRLDMVEPVLQGYARSGETKFVVILSEAERDLSTQDFIESEQDSGSDQDGLEIDESFLASSVLLASSTASSVCHDSPLRAPAGHSNGIDVVDLRPDFFFRSIPLHGAVSPVEDDYTMYLRTSDLGKAGALNGDWVRSLI